MRWGVGFLLLGVTALSLVGCSSAFRKMRNLAISPEFSAEETEAIIQASDDWCEADSSLCLEVFISSSRKGGSIQPSPRDKCLPGQSGLTVLSVAHAPRIHICRDDLEPFQLRWLARHELGHAFSREPYNHLPEPNTMATELPKRPEQDAGITSADLAYVL